MLQVFHGTPYYTAPEVQRWGLMTPGADIYSYGVVLWELLHGTPPWRALLSQRQAMAQHQQEKKSGAQASQPMRAAHLMLTVGPGCPLALRFIIEQCLSETPRRRPSSEELVHRLQVVLSGLHKRKTSHTTEGAERGPAGQAAVVGAAASSSMADGMGARRASAPSLELAPALVLSRVAAAGGDGGGSGPADVWAGQGVRVGHVHLNGAGAGSIAGGIGSGPGTYRAQGQMYRGLVEGRPGPFLMQGGSDAPVPEEVMGLGQGTPHVQVVTYAAGAGPSPMPQANVNGLPPAASAASADARLVNRADSSEELHDIDSAFTTPGLVR